MPRTRSLAWSELKVGVLSIAAVLITATTIVMLTGGRGFFWQRYSLKTRFGNVAGLKPGSPVRLAGVEVGSVQSVDLAGQQVEVTFELNDKYQPQITTESRAVLGSISLLGESSVDISASSAGTPIPDVGVRADGTPGGIVVRRHELGGAGYRGVDGAATGRAGGQRHHRQAGDR